MINEKENKDVQKVSVGKVSESVIQGIKVSGNVEKWVTVFRRVCWSLKVLHLMHSKEHLESFWSTVEKLKRNCSVIEKIAKNSSFSQSFAEMFSAKS